MEYTYIKYNPNSLLVCNTWALVYEFVGHGDSLHLAQFNQLLVLVLQVVYVVGRFGENAELRPALLFCKRWSELDYMVELCPDVFSSFLLRSNMVSLMVSITRSVPVEHLGET